MYDGEAWIDAGGGGGVSEEYVDTKVQEEATARRNADNEIRKSIPTKTSELENDSGFLTEHQSLSGYYTKTETDAKVQEEATARKNADDEIRKSIPAKTSQLTNDSGFLTKTDTIDHAISATSATTATAANTANSVQWNGVQGKPDLALKSEIPSKTSQLTNDSGFLTKSGTIDNALSAETATAANTANSVQWNGVQGKPVASATELGLVKVGSNLTIDADGKLNATGGGGGGGGIQPSDVTWTANNIGTYAFNAGGLAFDTVDISAGTHINFPTIYANNKPYPIGIINKNDPSSNMDGLKLDLDGAYMYNPLSAISGKNTKSSIQVIDMRDFRDINRASRLSVHFNTTFGNYTAQINGRIQTVQIPQNATSYNIVDPQGQLYVNHLKYADDNNIQSSLDQSSILSS